MEIFETPVQASDGFTYERHAIKTLFKNDIAEGKISSKSPVTGKELPNRTLVDSHFAKACVWDFKEKEKIIKPNNFKAAIANGDIKTLDGCRYLECQLEVIKLLVGRYTETMIPFIIAVDNHSIPAMRWLIKKGVDPTGCHALHRAVNDEKSSLKVAEFLLSNEVKCKTSEKYNGGLTPLHLVRTAQMAQLLIQNKADVHALDSGDQTPLNYCDNLEVLQVLLKAGGRLDTINNEGNTPLCDLIENQEDSRLFPFAFMQTALNSRDPIEGQRINLLEAVFCCSNTFALPYVVALFDAKEDWLEIPFGDHKSILSYGPPDGNFAFVLDFCVSSLGPSTVKRAMNHCNNMGRNVIHHWVGFGVPPAALKEAVRLGADWKTKDCYGYSGLHLACEISRSDSGLSRSYIQIFVETVTKTEFLIEVNALDHKGNSPLDLAIENAISLTDKKLNHMGEPPVIAALLLNGAKMQPKAKQNLSRLGVDFMLLILEEQAKQVVTGPPKIVALETPEEKLKAKQIQIDTKELFATSLSFSSSMTAAASTSSQNALKVINRLDQLINTYKAVHGVATVIVAVNPATTTAPTGGGLFIKELADMK